MIQKNSERLKIKIKINEHKKIIARQVRLNVPKELLKPRIIELKRLESSLKDLRYF